MFAIVRTGGKQYRVAAGDKIVVEKLDGEAGAAVSLSDVLLAGDGTDLKSVEGLIVSAEIVAQGRGEKIIVFKKRRRHNYRRKAGHRQQHTIIEIVSIGGKKADKPVPSKAEAKPAKAEAPAKVETKAEKPVAEKPAAKAEKPSAAAEPSTNDAAPAKAAAKKAAPKAPTKPKK